MKNRELLRDNLKALMAHHGVKQTGFLPEVSQATIDRILRLETAADLDTLLSIGRVFHLEIWQLMTPELDPANPPKEAVKKQDVENKEKIRAAAEEILRLQ